MDDPQRRFLRDLTLLLGLPMLLVAALVVWWKPWTSRTRPFLTLAYEQREADARSAAVRDATWHGLRVAVPDEYVILSQDSVVEVLEWEPPAYGNGNWGSHLAFLPLTAASRGRFEERGANCSLAPGRCWEETVGSFRVACQQAAGAPVPELWWTPLTICQAPDAGLWLALNAREERRPELWEIARGVLRDANHRPHE